MTVHKGDPVSQGHIYKQIILKKATQGGEFQKDEATQLASLREKILPGKESRRLKQSIKEAVTVLAGQRREWQRQMTSLCKYKQTKLYKHNCSL